MRAFIKSVMVAVFALAASQANAAKIPNCGNLPTYVVDAERNMAFCITGTGAQPVCAPAALDVKVFNNDQKRLPQAGNGQSYYEGKVRREPTDPAGTYRLVYLVTTGKAKSVIEERYYSTDHYDSFCNIL